MSLEHDASSYFDFTHANDTSTVDQGRPGVAAIQVSWRPPKRKPPAPGPELPVLGPPLIHLSLLDVLLIHSPGGVVACREFFHRIVTYP
jgi:hypothetical protein